MAAAAELQGQVGICAARQAIAPAGIPSGVAVLRLQAARLRGLCAAPVPLIRTTDRPAMAQYCCLPLISPRTPPRGDLSSPVRLGIRCQCA